jgi:hypothetical protein
MSTGKFKFTEREVSRAIRATLKAGARPQFVEVDRDGKIRITIGNPEPQQSLEPAPIEAIAS